RHLDRTRRRRSSHAMRAGARVPLVPEDRRAALLLGGAAIGLAALGAVVFVLARSEASGPARCADGMVALGARCCGEGQRLDSGRCIGAPARCARGLEVTAAGCVPPDRSIIIASGTLRVGPGDWEAQGIVEPREAAVAAFRIDAFEVTVVRWASCVAAGFCRTV